MGNEYDGYIGHANIFVCHYGSIGKGLKDINVIIWYWIFYYIFIFIIRNG